MGLNSGPVFGPTFSPFLECTSLLFFAQNKRKTSKTQFLSCQQAKGASTCCTRGDNDSLHIVLTMSFFRHCKGCNRENTSTDLTVFEAKMCSRQAVSKRLLRSYTAAFLDSISWSASRSSVPKKRARKWFPTTKMWAQKWDRFWSP